MFKCLNKALINFMFLFIKLAEILVLEIFEKNVAFKNGNEIELMVD